MNIFKVSFLWCHFDTNYYRSFILYYIRHEVPRNVCESKQSILFHFILFIVEMSNHPIIIFLCIIRKLNSYFIAFTYGKP